MLIRVGTLADLQEVFERFQEDFPRFEQLDRGHVELLMAKGRYHLLLAKHRVFDLTIGYAFVFEPATVPMLWLDYMAIDARFQSAGYGTLLFNKIVEFRMDVLGVLLEVEKADSGDPDVRRNQERRLNFYSRLGASALDVNYLLPTPNGGVAMYLLFRPSPGVHMLPHDQIKVTISEAYDYIHGDIADRDAQLKSFIHTIQDAHV